MPSQREPRNSAPEYTESKFIHQREWLPIAPGPSYMQEIVPGSYLWKSVPIVESLSLDELRKNLKLLGLRK